MAFFYSHPLTTTFLLAVIGFAIGGAAISGIGQRRSGAPDGNKEAS